MTAEHLRCGACAKQFVLTTPRVVLQQHARKAHQLPLQRLPQVDRAKANRLYHRLRTGKQLGLPPASCKPRRCRAMMDCGKRCAKRRVGVGYGTRCANHPVLTQRDALERGAPAGPARGPTPRWASPGLAAPPAKLGGAARLSPRRRSLAGFSGPAIQASSGGATGSSRAAGARAAGPGPGPLVHIQRCGGGLGLGVFASTRLRPGDLVTTLCEVQVDLSDPISARKYQRHTLKLRGRDRIAGVMSPVAMPGGGRVSGLASFINSPHGLSSCIANSRFFLDPDSGIVFCRIIGEVAPGEQLFVDYGSHFKF